MKPLMSCLALGNHFFHMAVIILLKSLLGGAPEHTQEPREKGNVWPPRARQKHWVP